MPSSYIASSQPVARHPPKPPKVVLAEQELQWIFTEDELLHTPSIMDGMPAQTEREHRAKGVNFIMQVGPMLKLPQTTLYTAGIFFNRFLMRHSLVDKKDGRKPLHHYQVAGTSIFLATKVEENCRKIKDLVVACCRVAQKNPNLLVDEQTKDFWRWRDTILLNEDVLLEMLCFDLTIENPYKTLYDLLKYYKVANDQYHKLRTTAWAFLNDSNITQLSLLYTSRTIAAAALYCAAKHCDTDFPDERGKPWWEVQKVKLTDIRRACNYMADAYENPPLKPGSNESFYVGLRTPEDGDPMLAKTRRGLSQTPLKSPTPGAASMERSVSSGSVKRPREEDVGMGDNGAGLTNGQHASQLKEENDKAVNGTAPAKDDGEREAKRVKTEEDAKPTATTTTKDEEAGSEEGEVEE